VFRVERQRLLVVVDRLARLILLALDVAQSEVDVRPLLDLVSPAVSTFW
jgi:hypothetical protein